MLVVAQAVGLRGVLITELGVWIANVSSPLKVTSSVQLPWVEFTPVSTKNPD